MADLEIFGRDAAQSVLDSALDSASSGITTTVSVVGEAGSGKTLLLRWLMKRAGGRFRAVAVRPVEGESDLPLATMVDILRQLREFLPNLSEEHRAVLSAAAGGEGRSSSDRLLLATSTLELFSSVADRIPFLLIIDDAHWVDETSAQALSFAIRRLLADRVAVVVARRPVELSWISGSSSDVTLDGLKTVDVGEILHAAVGVIPTASVVSRICDETSGNPLAVTHLAHTLPASVVSGREPLPLTLPLELVARQAFAGAVQALPPPSRSALTVLAAAGSTGTEFAFAALRVLGLPIEDLHVPEDSGLLTADSGQLEFGHPLYRAAALEVAGPVAVRRAHAALANVTDGYDLERHAWHRAHSVIGPNEDAAERLEMASDRAELRVGAAATAGLREFAVTLSPEGPGRAVRRLAAARALTAAGHHSRARVHLEAVLAATDVIDEVKAQAYSELTRLMLWDTPLDTQVVDDRMPAELNARQRIATLAVAALRARNSGELGRFRDLARSAYTEAAALVDDRSSESIDADMAQTLGLLPTLSLVAEAELIHGAHTAPVIADAVARVRRLVAAAGGRTPAALEVSRGLAAMLDDVAGSPAQMLTWTPDLDLAEDLLTLWLRSIQARPASIAYLLMARTELAGWTGDFLGGLSSADRAIEISSEVGSHALSGWTHAFAARLCAARGDANGCNSHGATAADIGARLAQPGLPIWQLHAKAQLQLSTGDFASAVASLEPVADFMTGIGFYSVRAMPWQPDFIEGLARAGQDDRAADLLESWMATMPVVPDAWHSAILARCRVLLIGAEAVDELTDAITGGALSRTPLEEARSQLVCASALKRKRQARAAAEMLGQAISKFDRLGARAWHATAFKELPASPGSAYLPGPHIVLTVQELRVAQEIAGGATYREVAARVFCSPKTVEYHMSHVYSKLGIRSRGELAAQLSNITRIDAA